MAADGHLGSFPAAISLVMGILGGKGNSAKAMVDAGLFPDHADAEQMSRLVSALAVLASEIAREGAKHAADAATPEDLVQAVAARINLVS